MQASDHLVLGLTGNIAAGKSTVGAILRGLGARVIDSDQTVRHLLATDAELLAEIRATFGDAVFDGREINRAALAQRVFGHSDALATLERLTHPRVGRETERRLAEPTDATVTFIEAIKVVEGPNVDRLNGLWIVESPADRLIQRAVEGRGMTVADARARLSVQSPVAAKRQRFIDRRPGRPIWRIANDATETDLQERVVAAWRDVGRYRSGDTPTLVSTASA